MRKPVSILFLLSSFVSYSYAQITFQIAYGGQDYDDARAVLQTSDGGYLVGGRSFSYGVDTGDIYLLKTDAYGNVEWSKAYGGPGAENCADIYQTSDSGYILCGSTKSFSPNNQGYLIKTDANGDTIWTRSFGNSCVANYVKEWPGGGYIVSGIIGLNTLMAKISDSGNIDWMKEYGSSITGVGEFVVLPGKGCMVGGYTNGFGALDRDFYLMRIDSMGYVLWSKRYESRGEDVLYSVTKTSDFGYLLSGRKIEDGTGRFLSYVIKTDSIGQYQWARTMAWGEYNELRKVTEINDSLYLLLGFAEDPGNGALKIALSGLDQAGSLVFSKAFGSTTDYGMDMQVTNDGGLIICGYGVNLGLGAADFHLIKTDQTFSSGCVEETYTASIDSSSVQLYPDNLPHSNYPGNITMVNTQVNVGYQFIPICFYDNLQSPPAASLGIFPNPASSELNLVFPEGTQVKNLIIKIFNVIGQETRPAFNIVGHSVQLNISNLKNGIYNVEISGEQMQYHNTFLKR